MSDLALQLSNTIAVITPDGELRRESSNALQSAVDQAIEHTEVQAVVISFREVTALMSEGIRLLVALHDRVQSVGKQFHITDLPHEVKYTLDITRLLDFLNHVETLDQVLHKYKTASSDLHQKAVVKKPRPGKAPPLPKTPVAEKPAMPVNDPKKTESESEPGKAPAAAGTEFPKSHAPLSTMSEEDMKTLIRHHLPGRHFVEVVDYFIKHHKNVAESKAIAQATGHNPKRIQQTLHELVERGVLHSMGSGMYNYSPEPELEEKIHYFINQWHLPTKQPRLLAMLLTLER